MSVEKHRKRDHISRFETLLSLDYRGQAKEYDRAGAKRRLANFS
jgi:hypothetical protein